MTAKKINELSAKTPVSTDVIPVADPTTGVAGKSTAQQVYDASLSTALSISYTGTAPQVSSFLIGPKMAVQANSISTVPNGVAVEILNFTNALSTTLSFDNLGGVNGALTFGSLANLASLSFPQLSYIVGAASMNGASTNSVLATASIPELVYVGGNFTFGNLSTATLSIPKLKYVGGTLTLSGNFTTSVSVPQLTYAGALSLFLPVLTNLSMPNLNYVNGNVSTSGTAMASMTNFSMPNLSYAGSIGLAGLDVLPAISFPELVNCNGNFLISSTIGLTTNLLSVSIPKLQWVRGIFQPQGPYGLTSLSMPALKFIGADYFGSTPITGQINIVHLNGMTSFTLPAIEVIGSSSSLSIRFEGFTNALTTFTLGGNLRLVDGGVNMLSCALNQASVDGILVRLAALDGTGVTTAYSSKTVTITGTSASPSATGLAAKATLVARGCTVTHN